MGGHVRPLLFCRCMVGWAKAVAMRAMAVAEIIIFGASRCTARTGLTASPFAA